MSPDKKINRILFDCERMKYPHTGLYHFCLQLGNALLKNKDVTKEKISFYMPENEGNPFGENVDYVRQKGLHKFLFPPIHAFNVWHGTFQSSNYFPKNKSLKKVLTIHDLNFLYEHGAKPEKINRSLKKIQQQVDNADKVCTISEYVKSDILKHVDIKRKNIEVIYNGCNIQSTENLTQPVFQPAKPFIFTIGTVMAKKNFHVLPSLLVNNDFQLVIAGIVQQEDYVIKIKEKAAKFGVSDRVVFAGAISDNDKAWYLKHCLAFAFTSLAEGFGLPVIEAMAFGKPVFLSTATSLPEIGGNFAYYFHSFDAEDMQLTFKKGMERYSETQPASAIIERAASFSWDIAAKKYLSIYRYLYS